MKNQILWKDQKGLKSTDKLVNFKLVIYSSKLDGSYQAIYADEIHFGTECEDLLIENIGYYCCNLKKQTINESFPILLEYRVAYYLRELLIFIFLHKNI